MSDSEPQLSELDGDLAPDASLVDNYKFSSYYHMFTEHSKSGMAIVFVHFFRN